MVRPSEELGVFRLCLDDPDQLNDGDTAFSLVNYEYWNDYLFCGPCKGIYFACLTGCMQCFSKGDKKRFLWNLATNEKFFLPPIISKSNIPSGIVEYHDEYFGFGFDPLTNDYKVVIIQGYKNSTGDDYGESYKDYPLSIMIYSLKADSWTYIGDLSKSYYISHNPCCTFVDRSYYWLGSHEEYPCMHDVMISLDLATEVWQEIVLPESRVEGSIGEYKYGSYYESLIEYHSSIAFVTLNHKEHNFDIWTLKDTDTVWKRQLTVELDFSVRKPLGHCYGANNNNYVVFESGSFHQVILWDPDTDEILEVYPRRHYSFGCKTISAYVESLVPLNDRDFWERKEEPHVVLS